MYISEALSVSEGPYPAFINRRRRNGLPVVLVEYVVGMLGGT